MKCPNCGSRLEAGTKFCGVCGAVVPDPYAGSSSPYPSYGYNNSYSNSYNSSPDPSPFASPEPVPPPDPSVIRPTRRSGGGGFFGTMRSPEGIALGTGERLVKQYKVAKYILLRRGTIDIIVTNKRIIRYEQSSMFGFKNIDIQEMNIDSVHGVTARVKRSVSIWAMLGALLLLIIGIIALISLASSSGGGGYSDYYGGYGYSYYNPLQGALNGFHILMMLIGFTGSAIIVIRALLPTVHFHVLGAIGSGALGTTVSLLGRYGWVNTTGLLFQMKPTAETNAMIKEIGACIYDLKTLGDSAIDKWLNSSTPVEY